MRFLDYWKPVRDDPEIILDVIEDATHARAQRLQREQQEQAARERQALLDEQRHLLDLQRVDAEEQAHVVASLIGHLDATLRDLEQLQAIEDRASRHFQALINLSHRLSSEWRTPWQRSRTPDWLMSWVSMALIELRRR